MGFPTIRAVMFDLDGVLRLWNPADDAAAERTAGLPTGALRRAAFAPDLLLPAITGHVSDEEWRQQVVRQLRRDHPDADAERAVREWSASAGEVNREALAVARACRQAARLVLVTNATSRLPRDLQRLGLAGEFDHIVNSSDVGYSKPQPEIFQAALRVAGVVASAAFFVDDSAGHVAAAAQLGMVGHVYEGVEPLRHALVRAGAL